MVKQRVVGVVVGVGDWDGGSSIRDGVGLEVLTP